MSTLRTRTVSVPRVSRQHPEGDGVRVTRALAVRLGKSESWAHRVLYQHPAFRLLCLEVPAAYRAAGDERGLARISATMLTALRGPQEGLSIGLRVRATEADAAEEVAQVAYDTHPTPATARAYCEALTTEADRQQRLAAALSDHWGLHA